MAVAAKPERGDKGQSAGFSPGTLMFDFVVKCNETNTVIEQVRSSTSLSRQGARRSRTCCARMRTYFGLGGGKRDRYCAPDGPKCES